MVRIMRRQMRWLLLAGWLLAPAALLAAEDAITVTQAQNGQEVTLKVGGILQIELRASGGTGYSWYVAAPGAPHVKLLAQTTRQITEPRPGAPILQVFRFQARQPGAAEIKLAYYRPWEGIDQAVDHFRLKLRID